MRTKTWDKDFSRENKYLNQSRLLPIMPHALDTPLLSGL